MKKSEERTINKLEKLSRAFDGFDSGNGSINKNESKKKPTAFFRTSEVIILLLLTCLVSLIMGGLVTYKIIYNNGKSIDKELQEIIKNYDYINDNYYDSIDKSKLVDAAVMGMLTVLDKHSSYVGDDDSNFNVFLEGNYKGIGIQVYKDEDKMIIYNVIDSSPASEAGLQSGDIILKVNDEDITGKSTDEFSELIKNQTKEFLLTFKRGDEEKSVNIKVSNVLLKSVFSKMIDEDSRVGYISTSIFANNTFKQFKKELNKLEKENINSLIIDLRGNSGGHLSAAEDILSLFLNSDHPIYQIESKNGKSKYYSKGKTDKKYKIIILVNSSSASASEVTASALKEQYGAIIIGEKTYGKGTVQELQSLSSGGQYKITTKKWLTSKGRKVDGVGVSPDIEVFLNDGYAENPTLENDNQLMKALEEAKK